MHHSSAALLLANEMYCPTPCGTMDIWFGIPVIDELRDIPEDSTAAKLRMYFKKMVRVRKSYIVYTIVSLFAEIGGYMGLLLGFSFMDFTRIVYKIVDLIQSMRSV